MSLLRSILKMLTFLALFLWHTIFLFWAIHRNALVGPLALTLITVLALSVPNDPGPPLP